MSIARDKVEDLRKEGKTFGEIGLIYHVSRQRIHQIFTGYFQIYQKSDSYLEYKRHYMGHTHPLKECHYCLDNPEDQEYITK